MLRCRASAVAASCGDGFPSTTVHEAGEDSAVVVALEAGVPEQAASQIPTHSANPVVNRFIRSIHLELSMPAHQTAFGIQELIQPGKTADCFLDLFGIVFDWLDIEGHAR